MEVSFAVLRVILDESYGFGICHIRNPIDIAGHRYHFSASGADEDAFDPVCSNIEIKSFDLGIAVAMHEIVYFFGGERHDYSCSWYTLSKVIFSDLNSNEV
jgi:hypothetical protein